MEARLMWKPFKCLENPDEKNVALIKLNTSFDGESDRKVFKMLWEKACLTAVVDGAINEIYRCPDTAVNQIIPDFISGDFDSAEPHILEYYKKKGVEIIPTPDQSETDFTKALRIVCDKLKMTKAKVGCICVHVSLSGRFDHIMGNINTLFDARKITNLPLYLISGSSVAFVIQNGKCMVNTASPWRDVWCGLVPIAGPCHSVTTKGLVYNVDHKFFGFGTMISTSNAFDGDTFSIETDNFLLVTIGLTMPAS